MGIFLKEATIIKWKVSRTTKAAHHLIKKQLLKKMFRKPFHVRGNTAMRGSDRRRLRADLARQFPILTAETLSEMFPNKGNVDVMKLTTHQNQLCEVYTNESQPLFFEIEQKLYPTVYTLWHHPDLLPSFSTWPPVIEKLQNGADLMLPGVVLPQSGLPNLKKHQPCAINIVGNKAAMAVGCTHWSTSDMRDAAMKGKGVDVIHCFRDHLWEIGDKSVPPFIPQESDGLVEEDEDDHLETKGHDQGKSRVEDENYLNGEMETDSNENGSGLERKDKVDLSQMASLDLNQEDERRDSGGAAGGPASGAIDEEEEVSPVDKMDALFYQCLLHALKTQVKPSELPLTTINLYRTHMRSVCPPNENLDVKKSSYKKLGKFLAFAQDRGLLEVKETSKGVDSVVSFEPKHSELLDFVIPDYTNPFAEETENSGQRLFSGDPGQPERGAWQGKLQEMYAVTTQVLPVLKDYGYKKGAWMKVEDIKKVVTDYVKSNELVEASSRSLVVLDPILHDILIPRTEGSITHLQWEQVFKRFLGCMTHGYQMDSGKASTSPWKDGVVKGKLRPINLKVEKKMGNKVVTVISNLEPYRIDPKVLSQKLQKGVAASSSISQAQGQRAGVEVRVQGNQIHYISKLLLEQYNIPKKHITGLDLAPKKGKKR